MPPTVARLLAAIAFTLLVTQYVPLAHAGVYTDDLSKCLVKSSTDDDRALLAQWMFAAMTLHPAVQSMATITAEQREVANKKMEGLFSRMLTDNCRKETLDALKYEGPTAIATGFQVFGQAAGRALLTDPRVAQGLGQLEGYFKSDEKLQDLMKEAGVPGK